MTDDPARVSVRRIDALAKVATDYENDPFREKVASRRW